MNPTTVISVRGVNTPAARLALTDDPSFVYVGRHFAGWPASIYGNPFKGPGAVERYREALVASIDRLGQSETWSPSGPTVYMDRMAWYLPKLRSKRLACWCGTWKPGQPAIQCHAWVLAEIVNALPTDGA